MESGVLKKAVFREVKVKYSRVAGSTAMKLYQRASCRNI